MNNSTHTSLSSAQAALILNGLPGVGPVTLRRLLNVFSEDPRAVLQASVSDIVGVGNVRKEVAQVIAAWEKHFDLASEEKRLQKHGVSFIGSTDADYPPLLQEIYDPPIGLYAKGTLRPRLKTVGIVGSRRTTLYGQATAKRLGYELARMGFCVISGMALGIDAAAHEGALEGKGETAAVLGCGVDIVYPSQNIEIYKKVAQTGVVLSEFAMGVRATKTSFPMRNRIISGMSQAIIVVESDASGGSMITARFAGEHGRQLFAVPGRIDQASSRGCHQLIRDGAILLTCIDDLITELAYGDYRGDLELKKEEEQLSLPLPDDWRSGLNSEEQLILECFLDGSFFTVDALVEKTELPIQAISSTLLMLEIKKRLAKRVDGKYELRYDS